MFFLYHHHDLNRLAELLDARLAHDPHAHPLALDTVIVPNRGIARWLQLQLAASNGIAANIDMPLPARFIWDLVPACLADDPETLNARAFGRESMSWHLYAVLPEVAKTVPEVAAYLAGKPAAVQRLQLGRQLGDVFDQYLIYRPTMLAEWEAGRGESGSPDRWQAAVWRALLARLGGDHRAALLQRFVDAVADPAKIPEHKLPGTVYCFGLDQLPPEYLKFFYALGQRCDLHFLLPNPCDGYWGDIETRRISLTAQPTAEAPDNDVPGIEDDHPLLASLGRSARDFVRLLYSNELSAIQEPDLGQPMAYEPPTGDTLLARVQADLIRMQAPATNVELADSDASIQIHACHGPLREVQVLQDQLLDLLANGQADSPRDIVVMMPDVTAYAPLIHSVFGGASGNRRLPYSVSDAPRNKTHPIVLTVQRLLDLPLTRWTASEVLELAEVPAIMRRFGLDAAAIDNLRDWTQDAGVRWGLDADTRAEFGAGEFVANTWRFGLDRMLLGIAHDDDEALIDGVAPWTDLEGGATAALGQLWFLLDRLQAWRQTLSEGADGKAWKARLNEMVIDLLAPDPADHAEQAALGEIHAAIGHLETAAECLGNEQLPWEVVRETVSGALASPGERQPFLSGGITFCSLEPLRGVPFQVVCLLGMDDGAFPGAEQSRAFNILRGRPRIGDASARDDDRLLFLQSLTAARSVFYLSYTGQDVGSGESMPPSTVVAEWLTFLHRHYCADLDTHEFERQLITRQPMHPFSSRYFRKSPEPADAADQETNAELRLFTYAGEWQDAGAAGHDRREPAPGFVDDARAEPPTESVIELSTLRYFFDNPAKRFLKGRLNLALDEAGDEIKDDEPQELDSLSAYQVRADLLEQARRSGLDEIPKKPDALWRARGLLPPPPLDAAPFAKQAEQADGLLAIWRDWVANGDKPGWIDIDLDLNGRRLKGRIENVWPDGLRVMRAGKYKLKFGLRAWIDYLAWRAAGGDGSLRIAALNDKRSAQKWEAHLDSDTARAELMALLDVFDDGQQTPLLFLPSLADVYLNRVHKNNKSEEDALGVANDKITDTLHPDRDAKDPYFQLLLAGDPPLGDFPGKTRFCALAEAIGGTLVQTLQPVAATA